MDYAIVLELDALLRIKLLNHPPQPYKAVSGLFGRELGHYYGRGTPQTRKDNRNLLLIISLKEKLVLDWVISFLNDAFFPE